jgi:Icc protein
LNPGTVKIAHISDLHLFGKLERRQLNNLDRMLDHFNNEGFDHLVISGDLSSNADKQDWVTVREKLEKHGLFHWEKSTVIAGNHDLINLEEEMRFYNALNPFSWMKEQAFNLKLADFCIYFQELVTGNEKSSAAFPYIKILRYSSLSIAIAVLNSVYPWHPADNPLGSRGLISAGQLRAMSLPDTVNSVKDCFVIGLCHHAYKVYGTDALIDQAFDWTMEMKNREEFLKVMKLMNADLVLHGHFHRFQSYKVNGISFINGGCFRYDAKRYSRLEITGKGNFTQQFLSLA